MVLLLPEHLSRTSQPNIPIFEMTCATLRSLHMLVATFLLCSTSMELMWILIRIRDVSLCMRGIRENFLEDVWHCESQFVMLEALRIGVSDVAVSRFRSENSNVAVQQIGGRPHTIHDLAHCQSETVKIRATHIRIIMPAMRSASVPVCFRVFPSVAGERMLRIVGFVV